MYKISAKNKTIANNCKMEEELSRPSVENMEKAKDLYWMTRIRGSPKKTSETVATGLQLRQ